MCILKPKSKCPNCASVRLVSPSVEIVDLPTETVAKCSGVDEYSALITSSDPPH